MSKHETAIKYLERKKELDPIYKKANRPGFGKKKYRDEHVTELEEWNKYNKYLKTNNIDESDLKTMKMEYEILKMDLSKATRELEEVKNEIRVMNGIKRLIKDMIPELMPEKETPTEEAKEQKRQSIYAKLADKQKLVEKNTSVKPPVRNRGLNHRE